MFAWKTFKNVEDRHFNEILFDVNILMKQIVDPIKGHQQAIEYREINMNKKPYLMSKDEKTIPDKVKEEISEST